MPRTAASRERTAQWQRLGEQRIALVSVLEELTVSALDLFDPGRSADVFLDRLAERLGCHAALLVETAEDGGASLHGATGISSSSRRLPLVPGAACALVEGHSEICLPYPELASPSLVRWHFPIVEPPRVSAALVLFFRGEPTLPAQYRGMVRRLSDILRTVMVHRSLYAESLESERRLDEKRALLECISEASTAGIVVLDGGDQVVFANRRFAELWGYPGEVVRSPRGALVAWLAERIESPRVCLDALVDGAEDTNVELSLKDGRVFDCRAAPVRSDGGTYYGRGLYFLDVTSRRRAEAERERLLETERTARGLAEEALRARDEFLSVASHELRTPLTSLRLVVQSALREAQGEGEAPRQVPVRSLRTLARQTQRLVRLVDTLLDVSRVTVGKLELEREPFDLVALTREVIGRFDEELSQRGATIELRAGDPVVGIWDRSRIDQVLTNLISNAIKYGEGRPIEIAIASGAGEATVVVRDQGLGIPRDRLAHVFQRFERAVSSRQFGGLGLGLFIVREIVDAHGGRVSVESELGRGSTFRLALPLGA